MDSVLKVTFGTVMKNRHLGMITKFLLTAHPYLKSANGYTAFCRCVLGVIFGTHVEVDIELAGSQDHCGPDVGIGAGVIEGGIATALKELLFEL